MSNEFRQLILCPVEPDWCPSSLAALQEALAQTGLLGDMFASTKQQGRNLQRYYVGEHFLQHINFMGCAPDIEFAPAADNEGLNGFIFLQLVDSYDQPCWLADLTLARPRCPACLKRFAKPAEQLDKSTGLMTCPLCKEQYPPGGYDWKESGGMARTMVSIVNAYPRETIPSANLLTQMQIITGVEWRYFYYFGELLK